MWAELPRRGDEAGTGCWHPGPALPYASMRPRRSGTRRRRRGRLFLWFERAVLGTGMTFVAFVIERRLLKAIKKGGMKPAPRTAAGGEDDPGSVAVAPTGETPSAAPP